MVAVASSVKIQSGDHLSNDLSARSYAGGSSAPSCERWSCTVRCRRLGLDDVPQRFLDKVVSNKWRDGENEGSCSPCCWVGRCVAPVSRMQSPSEVLRGTGAVAWVSNRRYASNQANDQILKTPLLDHRVAMIVNRHCEEIGQLRCSLVDQVPDPEVNLAARPGP